MSAMSVQMMYTLDPWAIKPGYDRVQEKGGFPFLDFLSSEIIVFLLVATYLGCGGQGAGHPHLWVPPGTAKKFMCKVRKKFHAKKEKRKLFS